MLAGFEAVECNTDILNRFEAFLPEQEDWWEQVTEIAEELENTFDSLSDAAMGNIANLCREEDLIPVEG